MDRVTLTSHANESDPAVNADHKRLVFALCVIVGISFVVGASLNFMLTPMLDDLGLTEAQAGTALAIPSIASLLIVSSWVDSEIESVIAEYLWLPAFRSSRVQSSWRVRPGWQSSASACCSPEPLRRQCRSLHSDYFKVHPGRPRACPPSPATG